MPTAAGGLGMGNNRVHIQVSCQYGGQGGGGYYEDEGMTDRAVEYYMMQQQVRTRNRAERTRTQTVKAVVRLAYGFMHLHSLGRKFVVLVMSCGAVLF